MPLPRPGQVIRYAYLWWNEARAGREDGTKDRPCSITTELNHFTWPGPDVRPTAAGEYLYGYLPEKLMRLVMESVKKNARDKRLETIPRAD